MGALEKVMELQSQGVSDNEIINKLKEQGTSPMDINDALNQAKIKSAISQPGVPEQSDYLTGMEQSVMPSEEQAPVQIQQSQEEYSPQQSYQTYDQGYYPQQTSSDTETISEIAEQVVSEKFREFEQKTGDISLFRSSMQEKVSDLDERLKKIENSLDKIQQAIIGKIGEYGQSMDFMHKDLENMHNTMSKLMNPLVDNYQELRKISQRA